MMTAASHCSTTPRSISRPPVAELEAYAERVGLPPAPAVGSSLIHLADSGYVRWQAGPLLLFGDVGPVGPDYQPGHAHADTLSFELSAGRERVVVDSGTSTYTIGPTRTWQRSTAAHSTVTIDGADSSEVWGGFRVARRARVQDVQISPERAVVSASHDGYMRLPGKPQHLKLAFDRRKRSRR